MLKLGAEKDVLQVVSDRVGSPAHAGGLAASVMRFVDSAEAGRSHADVWHYADRGVCSWYDLAAAIMRLANLSCRVLPVDGSSFPTKGPRPWYSVMDSSAIEKLRGCSRIGRGLMIRSSVFHRKTLLRVFNRRKYDA